MLCDQQRARSCGNIAKLSAMRACVCSARPRNRTRRPCARALCSTAPRRCTFEANMPITTRPSALRHARVERVARPVARRRRSLRPRRWSSRSSTDARRSRRTRRAGLRRSARRPSGSSSILKSPECTSVRRRRAITRPVESGIECVTRNGVTSNGPSASGARGLVSCSAGGSIEVGLAQAAPGPAPARTAGRRPARRLAQQIGQGADVVLVAVREHDRLDRARARSSRYSKSGWIMSMPGS